MADDSELIERVLLLSKSCILPPLLSDFDSNPIAQDNFNEYRLMADEQLCLLMDILYHNRNLLTDSAYDNRLVQLRVNLLNIACEQIGENPFFHSENQLLLQSLEKITLEFVPQFKNTIFKQCIDVYKESLKKDIWKKQFGMIHGCPTLCDLLFSHKPDLMDDSNLMFFLSVGSNLVAHHDPYYKTLGLNIYRHLMRCDVHQLKRLNIHRVIYSETLPLIQRSNEIDYNDFLYQCLYQIISIENSIVINSRWCMYDDVMSRLLSQFSYVSDGKLSKLLVYYIIKFCSVGNADFKLTTNESLQKMSVTEYLKYFEHLKSQFNQPNRRAQRWFKKLMELMVRESIKMLTNQDDCLILLNAFHIIYIMTIFTIESASFNSALADFSRKLILVQMKVLRSFKGNSEVLKSVIHFLDTIEEHQKEDADLVAALGKLKGHYMLQIKC